MRLRTKILIAAPLIIILLAAAGITAGLAINSNIRQNRYNDVLDNGPGAERAIWKNDDGNTIILKKFDYDELIRDLDLNFLS